ncbi:MAG: hypothetical protein ACRDLP_04625, partial [Solirubrobacteraceae bacterium]
MASGPASAAHLSRSARVPYTTRTLVLEPGGVATVAHLAAAGPARILTPRPGAAARAGLTFPQAVAALAAENELSGASASNARATWIAARSAYKKLRGARRSELGAVLTTAAAVAHAGLLVPSRIPELVLTLDANRRWWSSGPLLAADQRVGFPGSGLVWEYYPGQGIQ